MKSTRLMMAVLSMTAMLAMVPAPLVAAPAAPAGADACPAEIYQSLRVPAAKDKSSIEIRCSLTLSKTDVITKRIVFSGEAASGASLDCRGAILDGSRGTINFGKPTVLVRSLKMKDGRWSAPVGVTVRNCIVKGAIRLQGLGTNGQAKEVKLSSLTPGHTNFAQASAPADTVLSGLTLVADGRIPLYAGPGVTGLNLTRSTFKGQSSGTALYLDAESAHNAISANRFLLRTRSREQIAIDGSAHNRITNNVFTNPVNGGVFLYRNCGEGGTIRHQKPQYNEISGNIFTYSGGWGFKPAVWLNSRNGKSRYCKLDPARPFGSAASSLDFAQFNTITGNKLVGGHRSLIRNDDPTNSISHNGE